MLDIQEPIVPGQVAVHLLHQLQGQLAHHEALVAPGDGAPVPEAVHIVGAVALRQGYLVFDGFFAVVQLDFIVDLSVSEKVNKLICIFTKTINCGQGARKKISF